MRMGRGTRGLAALVGVLCAAPASAQVFGTLSWQMQPYCNVVTLTLTVTPTGFALDGHDDIIVGPEGLRPTDDPAEAPVA